MKNYNLDTMENYINQAYHSTVAITGDDTMSGEFETPSTDINLMISGHTLSIPNNAETFQLVKYFVENLEEYKRSLEEYPVNVIEKADGYWYYLKSSKTNNRYYVYYDSGIDAAMIFEEKMFDEAEELYEPEIFVGHWHVGGREEFVIPTKENYKRSVFKDVLDKIREYEGNN